jgi:hypothetical protein
VFRTPITYGVSFFGETMFIIFYWPYFWENNENDQNDGAYPVRTTLWQKERVGEIQAIKYVIPAIHGLPMIRCFVLCFAAMLAKINLDN